MKITNSAGVYSLVMAIFEQAVRDYRRGKNREDILDEIEQCTLISDLSGVSGDVLRTELIKRAEEKETRK